MKMFNTNARLYKAGMALTIGFTLFATSCQKKDTVTKDSEDTSYASDHMISEKTFSDVQSITDQAANVVTTGGTMGYKGTGLSSSPCAVVTHTGDSIIIDFGATSCLCKDGRYRSGKIICVYSGGHYADSGSVHVVTFSNFYQEGNKIEGTKTVTNRGRNSSGKPYFDVVISGRITKPSGVTLTTNWTRVRTWTAGSTTLGDHTDDVYSISGSGTITRSTGDVVAVNVDSATPLVVAYGCKWIEAGTITYTLSTGKVRSINFGTTPECNATATITWPGGTRVITMP